MSHLFRLCCHENTFHFAMSSVPTTRSDFWTSHFAALAKDEGSQAAQIDFSNHALVVQNYAYVLEAVGGLAGKNVLDAGFGAGELSRIFDLLGAKVSAIDVVPTRIPRLREQSPSIAWWQADLNEWTLPKNAEAFDIVAALESLQYVDFNDATNRLLSAVAVGGRLVILIPNADCAIVQRTSERFDGQYVGVSLTQLPQRITQILRERDDLKMRDWQISYRGISFQSDQSLVPYRSGTWQRFEPNQTTNSAKTGLERTSPRTTTRLEQSKSKLSAPHFRKTATPPNRLQIVFRDVASNEG